MRRLFGLAALSAAAMVCDATWAAKPPIPAPIKVAAPPAGARARSVEFATYQFLQPGGVPMGGIQLSPLCVRQVALTLADWAPRLPKTAFKETFDREVRAAGFPVAGEAVGSLFDSGAAGAGDLQVAASIKTALGDICSPLYSEAQLKGWVALEIEWQVYSPVKREVVARIPVTGVHERKETGPAALVMTGAFAEAVKGLLNDRTYRDLVLNPAPDIVAGPGAPAALAGTTAMAAGPSGDKTPIALGAPARKPDGLPEVVGSVVTILAGGGHGSGFLVSADGYLLTNAHVVGTSKTVKVRWSDNFETVGEVLRVEKGRDVALVKTDARGRLPLALRRGTPPLGEEVYAVGAPLDIGLSGTVTRGVVSTGNRIFGGYSFVQSDVSVSPGNSGGPLVTKGGEVVALTVAGYRPTVRPTPSTCSFPPATPWTSWR